ncbi:MAG TPA: hypothetical protein VEN81_16660 [Planctomycetota bacterium]|nr:hypothetical protein [Planctomycetota bacterium]
MMNLEEAYRGLSSQGSIQIPCPPGEILQVLAAAEKAGFHGLRVENGGITAWKGKAGPCYDTGRTAAYHGSAAAALDDDRHLLFDRHRICEKTARIYEAAPYRPWIDVSEPDPALLQALDVHPRPFDCDSFQVDVEALAGKLPGSPSEGPSVAIFYPGPFKSLILRDGTLLPRGRWIRVPADAARALVEKDGARTGGDTSAEEPAHFVQLIRSKGAAGLFEEWRESRKAPRPPDLRTLADASDPMRHRLQAMIERKDPYFILTGSDPSQKDGCCPSTEVGEANGLVRSGVLETLEGPGNASCPVTIYAFVGEIVPGNAPEFRANGPLRASVLEAIREGRRLTPRIALRAGLVLFALASLLALAWGLYRHFRGGSR